MSVRPVGTYPPGSQWFQSERDETTRRQRQCFCRITNPAPNPTRHAMDCTMVECLKTLPELKVDRRAVTALEYALIAGLLAIAVLAASSTLGASIENAFTALAHLL